MKQEPPLPVSVELAPGRAADAALARGDPRPAARGAPRADDGRAGAVREPAAQRVQVEARRAPVVSGLAHDGRRQLPAAGLADRPRAARRPAAAARARARALARAGAVPRGRRRTTRRCSRSRTWSGPGIDIITDGEMRRESYSNRFATALDGVDLDKPGVALDRTGHENPVPRVVGPIRRTRPVEVRDVEFLRAITDRRIKITVPGPFTMTQQAQNDHYADDREPRARLRRGGQRGAARPEGCRRRRRPDRRAVPAGAARAGARVRARGDQPRARRDRRRRPRCTPASATPTSSTTGCRATRSWTSSPTAARRRSRSRPRSRDLDPELLRALPDKTIVLGVLDLGAAEVETPEVVAARLRRALEVRAARAARRRARLRDEVPARASGRCDKLEAMVAGARLVSAELMS